MTTIDKIKQEFETLKGQFVITTVNNKIERLVAIGTDQQDYYYITYNGRKFTWNTCLGRIIPLKGYLRDEDYNELVRLAKLNDFDQEEGFYSERSQKHKNELMKVSGNDTILTEVCWSLI
jgi:hypothetical protein